MYYGCRLLGTTLFHAHSIFVPDVMPFSARSDSEADSRVVGLGFPLGSLHHSQMNPTSL